MAEITLYVTLNTNKAIAQVQKLNKDLANALAKGDTALSKQIEQHIKAASAVSNQSIKVDELRTRYNSLISSFASVEQAELLETYQTQGMTAEYTQLQQAIIAAQGADVQSQISSVTNKLSLEEAKLETLQEKASAVSASYSMPQQISQIEQMQQELDQALEQLDIWGDKAAQSVKKVAEATDEIPRRVKPNISQTESLFERLGNKLHNLYEMTRRIMTRIVIFSTVGSLLRNVISELGDMFMSNQEVAQSVEQLKQAFYMLAVPIYEAVVPALKFLLDILTKVVTGIAVFIYALMGKSYAQLVKNSKALRQQTANYKKSTKAKKENAKAQKEVNKQLAAFDELIILQDEKQKNLATGGGGGGGIGGMTDAFGDLGEAGEDLEQYGWVESLGKWIRENGKILLTVAAIAALALGIKALIDAFHKKDESLDTQTEKTGVEAEAVRALSKVFNPLGVTAASLFGVALGGLTNKQEDLETQTGGLEGALQGLTVQTDDNKLALYNNALALVGLTEQQQIFQENLETTKEGVQELTTELGIGTQAAQDMSTAYNGTLEPAVENAKQKTNDYKGAVQSSTKETVNNTETVKQKVPEAEKTITTSQETLLDKLKEWTKDTATKVYNLGTSVSENTKTTNQNIIDTTKDTLREGSIDYAKFVNDTTPQKQFSHNWGKSVETVGYWFNSLAAAWDKILDYTRLDRALGRVFTLLPKDTAGYSSSVSALSFGGLSLMLTALAPFGLANGGVIPPNKKFLAVLGDQTSGYNIETPLSTMVEAFNTALDNRGGNFGSGNTTVVLEIDGREFGKAVVEQGNRETRRIGTKLVVV